MTHTLKDKKSQYCQKFRENLLNYSRMLLIQVDNVRGTTLHTVRKALFGTAEIQLGKNTLMRRTINSLVDQHPDLNLLLPHIVGNVGFVFTNESLRDVKTIITANRTPAPAKAGALAPCDVYVQAGLTGCEPGLTSFFQVLQVPTKITRGQIEIINTYKLIDAGQKVTAGHAALLDKLGVRPFEYGIELQLVYDSGKTFDPKVLDLDDAYLSAAFSKNLQDLAALSLRLEYPTLASLPHTLRYGVQHLAGLYSDNSLDYPVDALQSFIAFFRDPSAFAQPAAQAVQAETQTAVVEEEEEESDVAVGGLFGSDDESD